MISERLVISKIETTLFYAKAPKLIKRDAAGKLSRVARPLMNPTSQSITRNDETLRRLYGLR